MSGQTPTPQQFAAELAQGRLAALPYVDPMRVGPGTPWEDRGSKGVIKAFVATCLMAMFRPTRLYHAIRRPETYADARSFAMVCLVLWGLCWVANSTLGFYIATLQYHNGHFDYEVLSIPYFIIGSVLQFIVAVVGGYYLLQLAARLLHSLVIGETRAKFRPVLTLNVLSYAMGPSLLVAVALLVWILFPLGLMSQNIMLGLDDYYGIAPVFPIVAGLWILASAIRGTLARLRLRTLGAVICNIIPLVVVLAAMAVAYGAGWLFWWKILGMKALDDFRPSDHAPANAQTEDTAGHIAP